VWLLWQQCWSTDFIVIGRQLHSIREVGQEHKHCDLDIMESCSTGFYVGEGCFAVHPEESLLHEKIVNLQTHLGISALVYHTQVFKHQVVQLANVSTRAVTNPLLPHTSCISLYTLL